MGRRLGAICGIAAPACFVGGWLVAGLEAEGYDPVQEHISELARVGAGTRPLMTAALVGFGVLAPAWARTLGRSLRDDAVSTAVTAAALGTLAVAAFPLGRAGGDGPIPDPHVRLSKGQPVCARETTRRCPAHAE